MPFPVIMIAKRSFQINTAIFSFYRRNHTIPKERLRDKVAIVTASTKGIGFAIAKRLAQEGAKVIISSRKQENVDRAIDELTAHGLNVTGQVCHVAKAEDRKNLFNEAKKLGGVDILVSNAAVNPNPCLMLDSSCEQWDKMFEINVKAPFLLSQEAVPFFRSKGGGGIVFISSYIAYQPSMADGTGIYSVTKTALLGLAKALAYEIANDNIRVNCVCPGVIHTDFGKHIINKDYAAKIVLSVTSMSRFGNPDEISGAVAFLVSDDSSYITGESIVVSGGGPTRL